MRKSSTIVSKITGTPSPRHVRATLLSFRGAWCKVCALKYSQLAQAYEPRDVGQLVTSSKCSRRKAFKAHDVGDVTKTADVSVMVTEGPATWPHRRHNYVNLDVVAALDTALYSTTAWVIILTHWISNWR